MIINSSWSKLTKSFDFIKVKRLKRRDTIFHNKENLITTYANILTYNIISQTGILSQGKVSPIFIWYDLAITKVLL